MAHSWKTAGFSGNSNQSYLLVYGDIKSTKPKIQQSGMYETFYRSGKGKKGKDGWGGSKKMSISERKFFLRWALYWVKLKQAWPTQKFISNFQVPIFRLHILVSRSCPHVNQTSTLNSLWTDLKPSSSRLHFRLLQTLSNHCHPSSTA